MQQLLELDMEQQAGSKSGKEYVKAVYCHPAYLTWASLVAQMVKRLPAMWETRVRFLGQEDPLEKEWQSTPALLPGKSQGWRSLIGYSPWSHQESDTTEWLHFTMLKNDLSIKMWATRLSYASQSQQQGEKHGEIWIWGSGSSSHLYS